MKRRELMMLAGGLPLMSTAHAQTAQSIFRRIRPGDPPGRSAAQWSELSAKMGGQLVEVRSPLAACRSAPESAECAAVFRGLKNPWYIGDNAALTQTSGWADAWTSAPSAYAVAARNTADVAAAVNFARAAPAAPGREGRRATATTARRTPPIRCCLDARDEPHRAARRLRAAGLQDAPQPAVSLGAGAVWIDAYDAVDQGRPLRPGRRLHARWAWPGLVQSGGFGSFSKCFGTAASSLLEAEIVTADGEVRIANACTNPDLFWALKGGGGGSLGVVTRLTSCARTTCRRASAAPWHRQGQSTDAAYRRLIERFVAFYADALFNPHWGEQVKFHGANVFELAMIFQDLDRAQAEAAWRPFLSLDHRAQAAISLTSWRRSSSRARRSICGMRHSSSRTRRTSS